LTPRRAKTSPDGDVGGAGTNPSKLRVFLIGPTASGKSAVAEALADTLKCRLLSMDSMSVFRHMDIGTAKPPAEKRPLYRLIDLVEPKDEFSVARYIEAAEGCASQGREAGLLPLFAGGTALYFKTLVYGLFEGPSSDWALRDELRTLEAERGPGYLHRELSRVDPETAQKLHPNDTKRVVRALEVYRTTGVPISRLQKQWKRRRDPDVVVFEIARPREELYARIEQRVDDMFTQGLVAETERIRDELGGFGKQASEALGYREVLEHVSGTRDLKDTIELVKTNTRRFAKRQLTWFRGFQDVIRLGADARSTPESLAARVAEYIKTLTCG